MKMIVLIVSLLFSAVALAQPTNTNTQKSPQKTVFRKPAAAGAYTHEITTNLTSGSFFTAKNCEDCTSGSAFVVGASYLRFVQGNTQFGAEGLLRILSKENSISGTSETLIDLAAIAVQNFSSDFANSYYIKGGLGFAATPKKDNSGYENAMGFFAGGGKRFAWLPNVTYTPEFRLVKRGGIEIGLHVAVLNFSILW